MKFKLGRTSLLRARQFSLYSVTALLLLGVSCTKTAKRTGEVEVYKITPASPARGAGAEERAYIMKARGFAVGENSFRLTDSFGGFGAVTVADLQTTAQALEEDAYKALLRRQATPQDPETEALAEIHDAIGAIKARIAPPTESDKHLYAVLKDVQEVLYETEAVSEVYDSLRREYEKRNYLLNFPYVFRVSGRSLQRGKDYVRRQIAGNLPSSTESNVDWDKKLREVRKSARNLNATAREMEKAMISLDELASKIANSSESVSRTAQNLEVNMARVSESYQELTRSSQKIDAVLGKIAPAPEQSFEESSTQGSSVRVPSPDVIKLVEELLETSRESSRSAVSLKKSSTEISEKVKAGALKPAKAKKITADLNSNVNQLARDSDAMVMLTRELQLASTTLAESLRAEMAPTQNREVPPLSLSVKKGTRDFIHVPIDTGTVFYALGQRLTNNVRAGFSNEVKILEIMPLVESIVLRYREMVEYGLNFAEASHDPIRGRNKTIYRLNDQNSKLDELPILAAFDRTAICKEAINISSKGVIEAVKEKLRASFSGNEKNRLDLENLARRLADKTGGSLFRPLLPAAENAPATLVTFELRTLYLRALGKNEPRNTQGTNSSGSKILVTCAVKNSDNATDATYPIIYEEDYAPGYFLNRKDRIIYGPAPYNGMTFDVRFTVMELSDITGDQISSAISSATAMISLANPELAAISPLVNAFFGSLVENIDFDRKEFDVSFTLPQPSAKNKSNTRFLVSETGHYILLKKENSGRDLGDQASLRQLYRSLIYNEEDGYLYKRVDLANPAANFKRENLFLDQSYAVIVVTDQDSNDADKLGDKLRQQVAQSLGEARSKKLIPDVSETMNLISQFQMVTGRTNQLGPIDGKMFGRVSKELKNELWNDISDSRKAFIIDTLLSRSDPATRTLLGTNPEKWKNAEIEVSSDGIINYKDQKPREQLDTLFLPEQATQTLLPFGAPVGDLKLNYFVENDSGSRHDQLANLGGIDSNGQINLALPVDGTLNSAWVRAVAIHPQTQQLVKSKKYEIRGLSFNISSVAADGKPAELQELSAPTNTTPKLKLTIAGPPSFDANGYELYQGDKLLGTSSGPPHVLDYHVRRVGGTNTLSYTIVPVVFKQLYLDGKTNGIPVRSFQLRRPPR